jgi:thiamine pyrophosphokinase
MARLVFQLLVLQLILYATVFGLLSSSSKKIQGTKYNVKQKVLTLGSSFTIKDDKNKPVYKVKNFSYEFFEIYIIFFFRLDLNN